jgi:hypothetical protein
MVGPLRTDSDAFYMRDLGAHPLTPADRAAWRKAGSPSTWRVWSNDHYATLSSKPGASYGTVPGTWGQGERTTPAQKRKRAAETKKQCAPKSAKCSFSTMTWADRQKLASDPARFKAAPADTVAWRKAGSPHAFLTVEGKRTTTSPEPVFVQRGAPDEILTGMGAAAQAGLSRLRELPADPGRLRAWLLTLPDSPTQRHPIPEAKLRAIRPGLPRPSAPPPPTKAELDHWLFVQGADLILYSPVTSKARAAAFRMLAALPGVKLIGTVRDADGRKGTAVAMDEIDPGDKPEQIQHRLVIDPADGRALADEEVVVGPNIIYPNLLAGAIASTTTVRSAGWTDKAPA